MTIHDTTFDPKTWNAYVNTVTSTGHPRCGRVRAVRGLPRREGVLHLQPHRRGGARDAKEPREARLSDGRRRRHHADDPGSSRTGARPRARGARTSPRTTASCSTSATTSATSSTSTGAPRRSASRSSSSTRTAGAANGS